MSDPLFQNTDDEERRYVGEPRADEQPTQPPRIPSPAFEHGTLTTPPLRADRDGLRSEPIDQGALGDNRTSAAPHLTYVDTDSDEEGEQ
jgi:hypothetical protein